MLNSIKNWFLALILLTAFHPGTVAQNGKKSLTKVNIDTDKETFFDEYNKYVFRFKNLDKPYYYDESTLKQIHKLEKKGEYLQALSLLERYVANFGIQNFYIDMDLMWRLGQLYELMGQVEKAKSLYRLTLKHYREIIPHEQLEQRWTFKHRERDQRILLYYDSIQSTYNHITELERDYYIPLDYYYELVDYRRSIDTLIPPRNVLSSMGSDVNSEYPDYAPSLAYINDTLFMFYSSKRARKVNSFEFIKNEDVFITWNDNDYWTPSKRVRGLNTNSNEGSIVVYDEGRRVIFSRCNTPDGYGNCDLYEGEYDTEAREWMNIKNLGPNINGSSWESQPALNHSNDTLYFASDRLGGFGLSDLYFSVKRKDGSWGPSQNMGPIINTYGNEVSPYFHPTYNVLYFSSTGHIVNFGDFDIYKSYFRNGHWQEPKNVGPLVNGEGSEYYFTIDRNAEVLYYARSEKEDIQNLDLFSFPLPMGARPDATTVFKGKLQDKEGNIYPGIVSILDLDEGVEVAPKALRSDGSFDFELIKNRNYLLVVQGEDFFRIEKQLRLSGDTSITIEAERVVKSAKITFDRVEFEPSSAKILDKAYEDLQHVRDFLIDNPRYELIISGHTDSKGDHKVNLKLSQERANAIKAYLIKEGAVEEHRIKAYGFGDTKPIVAEEITEEDRRKNRRVEFELVAPDSRGNASN